MSARWTLEEFLRERLSREDFLKADDLLDDVEMNAEDDGYRAARSDFRD